MDIEFEQAVEALRAGRPLVFPTDTVVGLGVAVEYARDLDELFSLKARDAGKPIAWLVDEVGALERYGRAVPAYARELARAFWPGALTLVVNASARVSAAFRASDGSIGLRMPASELARALIEEVGSPLATTSANLSGKPAASLTGEVDPALARAVAVLREDVTAHANLLREGAKGRANVLHEGASVRASEAACTSNSDVTACANVPSLASTVIDCRGSAPIMVRAGTITASQIDEALQGAPKHIEEALQGAPKQIEEALQGAPRQTR